MSDERVSTGWMRLALRARICDQCDPRPGEEKSCVYLDAHECESRCAYFSQLPRLARLLKRHHARPPTGYEEFAIELLHQAWDVTRNNNPLWYAPEALATLEKVAELSQPPPASIPKPECVRRDIALGQLDIESVPKIKF